MKQKRSLLIFLSVLFFSIGFASTAEAAGVVDTSISEQLAGTTATSLVVVPSPTDGSTNKEYASTNVGLKQALYDLYQANDGGDYAIYVGTNIGALNGADAKAVPASPSATDITFTALEGRIGTLVFTSTPADTINTAITAATGARTITFSNNSYMGTNVVLRNITYNGATNLFMNGHDLTLGGSSYGTGTTYIYGGSDSSDVTGSPNITVNSTGSGTFYIYGGNRAGGTLTGDTNVTINQTSTGGLNTLSGGAQVGTVNGNVNVTVKDITGTLTNYYGGGQGTSATATANVTGNVTTEINSENSATTMRFGTVYGGTNYGNISGSVKTTFKGYGGWTAADRDYYGGSAYGSIGSDVNADAIVNDYDTSLFTTGIAYYNGANSNTGTITGNIRNTIKAGRYNYGSIRQINGASGRNVTRLTHALLGSDNLTTYDAMDPAERQSRAKAGAAFSVYGDVYTDVLGGAVAAGGDDVGFTKGFGWGGYLEGNTYLTMGVLRDDNKVGGDGMVYDGDSLSTANYNTAMSTGIAYAAAPNRSNFAESQAAQFDIVGGGGSINGWTSDVFIQGDTNVVLNNVIARWTYGAGFSGVTQGNTNITLNGGIVDTLEGAGYYDRRIYGTTNATVNNGQVDWFLSGGGWNSNKVVGDANVTVYDGVINASMGASYGDNSAHTIEGNSNIKVYGGDFSGMPRTGNNAFSAGVTQQGYLTGNSNLTIDLRDYKGTFKFPTGTYISAGKPYNGTTRLGTDASNTMNLNIFTDESSGDVLNGAIIYGDGNSAGNTLSGKVNINIDAPGSTIGTLYATQYNNVNGNNLLRSVEVNIQRIKSIGGISGGSAGDNITNTVAAGAATAGNYSLFNIGVPVTDDAVPEYQTDPILVSGLGIINFTNMVVDNGTTITASSGNIKNGNSATAGTHASTYNQFGDIQLKNNAGLGVTGTNAFISAGKLTIQDENQIESGQGHGVINISDIEFTDPDNSRLTWVKNNTATTPSVTATGTWFGTQTGAYQVLTINPTVANASKITPFNFKGYEKATGKTFIGDNDVTGTSNSSGYGLMIPGSVIDYVVTNPVVDGKGDIEHNVTDVLANNSPTPLKVWGTEVAGTKVQKGRLIIPSSSNILPTLTFTPETATTGSWLYNATIVSSQIGSTDKVIAEQVNSNPVDWTSTDGSYSYEVEVQYSNKVELAARNVILTESEAAALATEADVNEYTEVDGRPFLESDINAAKLTTLTTPLAEDEYYRVVPVKYTAGTAAANAVNTTTETVNVVIVKDAAKVSTDKHSAIYAENVTMKQQAVADIADQAEFESDYSHAFAIESDGTTHGVNESTGYFAAMQAVTPEETPKTLPVTYTYTSESGEVISKAITVNILPNSANLVVEFVDENNNSFLDGSGQPIGPLTYTRDIGTTIDLKTEQDVMDAIAAIEAQYYVIDSRPDADPIEIVNGGSTVTYKFKGTLSIYKAPSLIEFGVKTTGSFGKVSATNPTYDEQLVVKDNRATQTSWTLTASLTQVMTSLDDTSYTLEDSLKYKNDYSAQPEVLGLNQSVIITEHENAGVVDYNVSQAEWEDKDNGFVMDVSATQYRLLGDYQAIIKFTVADTYTP